MTTRPRASLVGVLVAGAPCVAVFLLLTVPRIHWGPVNGTGQDDWYNAVRALRALYEGFDPSYFVHPALFYELLGLLYGIRSLWLSAMHELTADIGLVEYFLVHQLQFLDLARWASIAYAALAVVASVWLGTVLSGAAGGLLAGLIVASLPLLQALANCIRVDTLSLAALLAATALVVRCRWDPSRRALFAAAAMIGVAAAANYPAALLLALLGWLGERRPVQFGEACAQAFLVFLLLNPYVVLDFPLFLKWFTFQGNVAFLTHPHAEEPDVTRYLTLLVKQGPAPILACAAAVLAATRPREPIGAIAVYGLVQLAAFSLMRSQYDRFVLPAITLLSIAGASWICVQLARIRPWVPSAFAVVAIPFVLWGAAVGFRAPLPGSETDRPDYRRDMFDWIAAEVPPSATLLIESDTMPLLQIAYDRGDRESPFQDEVRRAFEKLHPRFVRKITKCQFIASVYNYDPKLIESRDAFFLASSENREFIDHNRAVLAEPAAFYEALDERATIVHESGGYHEKLVLYAMKRSPPATSSRSRSAPRRTRASRPA